MRISAYGSICRLFLILSFLLVYPILTYALPYAFTYLGGNHTDGGWPRISMAMDNEGNIFIASTTQSQNFPTTDASYSQDFVGGSVVYISKFNPDLSELLASTFIGGGSFDFCYALAVDDAGNVYVTGHTSSGIFPTTLGVYGPDYFGDGGYDVGDDVFISKFDNDLSTLLASTFIGGEDWEMATDIKIAGNGDVVICGFTNGADYPVSDNAYDNSVNGNMSVFISRLDANLTTLASSTFLSTRFSDDYPQIVLDHNDNVFITGTTNDNNFPVTEDCLNNQLDGFIDAYVSCLNSDLSELLASTYLGGPEMDFGYDIDLDSEGRVYVVGHTTSTDLPGTSSGIHNTPGGGPDGFVIRLNVELTEADAGTYFGGTENDNIMGLVIKDNDVFLSGYTDSQSIGASPNCFDFDYNGNTDAFVLKTNLDFTQQIACTYFGGSSTEHNNTIITDNSNNIYFCGSTRSNDLPTRTNSYDPGYNGAPNSLWEGDVYIARLNDDLQDEESFIGVQQNQIESFDLLSAYPNPFNSMLEITYELRNRSMIKIDVYNIHGEIVTTLVNDYKTRGTHLTCWNAKNITSGTYLIKLTTASSSQTFKAVLLK